MQIDTCRAVSNTRAQTFLIVFDHLLNFFATAFGLAVAGARPKLSPQSFKRQTAFGQGLIDCTRRDSPADTYLLYVIDQFLLCAQNICLNKCLSRALLNSVLLSLMMLMHLYVF